MTRCHPLVYVSGLPPFGPVSGDVLRVSLDRQTELAMDQMKLCLASAVSSLDNVLKCNVYWTSVEYFSTVNAIYSRYFPVDRPRRAPSCAFPRGLVRSTSRWIAWR